MRPVILASPYSGDTDLHKAYARACLRDSLLRMEAPFASHLLYTQVLSDLNPTERQLGMDAGRAWFPTSHACVVYTDLGISPGMQSDMDAARRLGVHVEIRNLEFGLQKNIS